MCKSYCKTICCKILLYLPIRLSRVDHGQDTKQPERDFEDLNNIINVNDTDVITLWGYSVFGVLNAKFNSFWKAVKK